MKGILKMNTEKNPECCIANITQSQILCFIAMQQAHFLQHFPYSILVLQALTYGAHIHNDKNQNDVTFEM